MRTFKKSCSTIAAMIATIMLIQGVGWAQWVDRSDELPGMKSGGDVAKQVALVGGVAAGALITYYFIKKSRDKNHSESAAAETSWVVQDPRAIEPVLAREVEKAMLNDPFPGLPSRSPLRVIAADSPVTVDASNASQESGLNPAR